MKLKQRDWTEGERRLTAVPPPLKQDRMTRAVLLAVALFGVAVLAGVVSYLVCQSVTFQDLDKQEGYIRVRTGKKVCAGSEQFHTGVMQNYGFRTSQLWITAIAADNAAPPPMKQAILQRICSISLWP